MKSVRKGFPFFAGILLAALCAVFLISRSTIAAEKIDKAQVQQIIKDYLKENPEVVIDALKAYQENQQAADNDKFKQTFVEEKKALFEDGLPFAGNPNGDVKIAEFFDYNCGYCKRAVNSVVELVNKDKNVQVFFHEFPILAPSSHDAARYAEAAHKQGKYYEYHQALLKMNEPKTAQNMEDVAAKLGMDVDKLRKDADSKEVREAVEKSIALAQKFGLRGTPGFIIGDVLSPGYLTYDEMQKIVDQVRHGDGG